MAFNTFAQNKKIIEIDSKEYQALKLENNLPKDATFINPKRDLITLNDLKSLGVVHQLPTTQSTNLCSCYIQPDSSYILALAPSDDGSSSSIALPFNFCLYGTNYNSVYINNNGNISFNAAYSTFSSNSFPDPTFIMVAPFWGDVDTQTGGTVLYKITPTALYVNWVGVGYFNDHTDKVNTFQLIITDGTDPVLPIGKNIAFCYGDMQWTTGDASSGTNGFGGTPATVGVNQGVGNNFIQIGRFDQAGLAYDGGYGSNDGVDWLDNQSFYFNSCNSTNIPPIISGLSNCDTVKICGLGDTLILNGLFLSPESGQTTTVSVNFNGTTDASIVNITNGNTASAQIRIIASATNVGTNIITFTATDNGTPAATSIVNVPVRVDTLSNIPLPTIIPSGNYCAGNTINLSVSPNTFDAYHWQSGASTSSIGVTTSGNYWVTVTKNGCTKTTFKDVVFHPLPTPQILGTLTTCHATPTYLYVDSASLYPTVNWSNNITTDSISVLSGTFTIQVTDTNGCTATSAAVTVVNTNPQVNITGNTHLCRGDSITLTALPTILPGVSFLWSTQATSQAITADSSGTYIVQANYTGGCNTSDTITVQYYNMPFANFTESPLTTALEQTPVVFTDLSTIITDSIVNWWWDFGDSATANVQNPQGHTYPAVGNYSVSLIVQTNHGCKDTIVIEYAITGEIKAPNIFTPNGDGKNDLLVFKNLEFFPDTKLLIYNRWGKKIYESSNYPNNWTGDGNDEGVYYYILSGSLLKKEQYGFFQILR